MSLYNYEDAILTLCLDLFSEGTLREIAEHLHLAPPVNSDPRLLREILVSYHERRPSQLEAINDLPLYPTEEILWDETIVPSEFYDGESESSTCMHAVLMITV